MAVISKVLSRTAAATTNTTLYTTTAGSTAIVTNILVTNATTGSATFTILMNSIELFKDVAVEGNASYSVDLKQVLPASQTLQGSASTTGVKFHVSGVEVA